MEPELTVNGQSRKLGNVGGHVTLLEWLRSNGLTGSKEGCAEGECGACAVLVARPDGVNRSRWTAINACLVPAAGLDNQEVLTAEGLGTPEELHPVQYEMAVRGGSQCGYCTPGFICSMASEFYRPERQAVSAISTSTASAPADAASNRSTNGSSNGSAGHHGVAPDPLVPGAAPDHEHGANGFDLHSLSGNLCRCTGYRPIRDAAYALAEPTDSDPFRRRLASPAPSAGSSTITSDQGTFIRPNDLAETLDLLAQNPDARLVAGSTDWGVELNIRHARAALTIGIDRIEGLRGLHITSRSVEIGAALTLTEIERGLAGQIPLLADLIPQFASRLIRNGATLGGNLGTGSPIGDGPPVLLALDASLTLASTGGEREVKLSEYFTGYRQTVKQPGELIKTIKIPTPIAPIAAFHKIAKRRFDDISSVAVAFALRLGDDNTVSDIKIGLGGVAATPLRATATEDQLRGKLWDDSAVSQAARTLGQEGTPLSDHRASSAYRAAMLRQSLLKFYSQNPAVARQEASS